MEMGTAFRLPGIGKIEAFDQEMAAAASRTFMDDLSIHGPDTSGAGHEGIGVLAGGMITGRRKIELQEP
jgi:hypothetical protein